MIDISLRAHTNGRGALVLDLGLRFRIVFLSLAAIVALAMGVAGNTGVFAIVLLVVLLLGASYDERWTFDSTTGTIVSRYGLLFAARTHSRRYDEITAVEYTIYRVGSIPGIQSDLEAEEHSFEGTRRRPLRRIHMRYGLRTRDDEIVQIETRRVRELEVDKRLPETIAHHVGVPAERVTM